MSELVRCRYDPSHRVKSTKLMIHEERCPNRNTDTIKICLFNPNHKIHKNQYNEHMKNCPNKPKLDAAFEERLINHEENKRKKIEQEFSKIRENSVKNNTDLKKDYKVEEKKYLLKKENEVIFDKNKIKKEEKDIRDLIKQEYEDDKYENNTHMIKKEFINIKEESKEEKYLNRKIKFDDSYINDEYNSREIKHQRNLINNNIEEKNDNYYQQIEKQIEIKEEDDEGNYQGEEFNNFF